MKPLWVLLSLFVHFLNSSADEDQLIVKTTKGPVKGVRLSTDDGKPVDTFLGIPYAQPPIGKLRFKPPLPAEPWTDTFDASEYKISCVFNPAVFDLFGMGILMSKLQFTEDCLHLNVWVPVPRPTKAAVMVWIYGGGFNAGTASQEIYDMKIMASEENVICVSMNYRVSSLGFLYLAHRDAPGNAGLYDQALALQWVKENIEAFGGDPDKITIFGESAGSISVNFHLLSPISRNLFNRAILQSGTANALFSTIDHDVAIQNALNLAKSVNCPNDPNEVESIIECLQQKDAEELTREGMQNIKSLPFAPVVDGSMVAESPASAIKNHRFKHTDILIGSNKEEGSMFLLLLDPSLFRFLKEPSLNRTQFLDLVKRIEPENTPLSEKAIVFEYTHWPDPEDSKGMVDALEKLCGDLYFTCPTANVAHAYAEAGNNVFLYQFRRLISIFPVAKWMGVPHGFDLFYLFGKTMDERLSVPAEEIEFTKRMLRYWCNFAKTGHPNTSPSGETEGIQWPVYTTSGREYLPLLNDSDKPHRALRARKCTFWDQHLPDLIELTDVCKTGKRFM